MSTMTTSKTIKKLQFLFASYGLPQQVVTDIAPQFTSEEFEVFMKKNGIQHRCFAPYYSSLNGTVERFNLTFKQSLRASEKGWKDSLSHCLADFLLTH